MVHIPEVYKCTFDRLGDVSVEKCVQGASGDGVYYLRRLRSYSPSNPDVRRLMAFIHGEHVYTLEVVPTFFMFTHH